MSENLKGKKKSKFSHVLNRGYREALDGIVNKLFKQSSLSEARPW